MANSRPDDSPPPLVLLANDQEWSARSLETVLGSQGFASARAFTGRQALELARRLRPDVIIADAGMPDISGIEICQRLRDDVEFPASTPIIVTTAGPASRAQRLEAYRAGAWEFLSQPIDADALLLKLQLFVRARREIDRSREESLIDDGTGLYNVRGLARRAREIGADASRRHTPLACVAVGSVVEDGAGGSADLDVRLAEHVSEIFKRMARSSDAVGRLGRGEFAVIAPAMDGHGALSFVERLKRELEGAPAIIDGVPRPLKVRAGYCAVADFAQSSFDAVELLLRAASALRQARGEEAVDGARTNGLLEVPVVQ
ncbi:MAG TPA: response regulator [Gemmatimonadaceae bacterium]|nr:response regulator [Gemmatimonadaceae bacterium]